MRIKVLFHGSLTVKVLSQEHSRDNPTVEVKLRDYQSREKVLHREAQGDLKETIHATIQAAYQAYTERRNTP